MKKYSHEWWASLKPEQVGDETEKIVEALFKQWNTQQSFAWHRLPDAKAGRGRIAAQPADYLWRHGPNAGFLEVKALKHEYRLPADRVTQLPTLKKWSMAGNCDLILVHHYMIGKWRIVRATELETGVPSWDLSRFICFESADAALKAVGYFGE